MNTKKLSTKAPVQMVYVKRMFVVSIVDKILTHQTCKDACCHKCTQFSVKLQNLKCSTGYDGSIIQALKKCS